MIRSGASKIYKVVGRIRESEGNKKRIHHCGRKEWMGQVKERCRLDLTGIHQESIERLVLNERGTVK